MLESKSIKIAHDQIEDLIFNASLRENTLAIRKLENIRLVLCELEVNYER
jgi:hypothetical protein